jgi:hypothetical protein
VSVLSVAFFERSKAKGRGKLTLGDAFFGLFAAVYETGFRKTRLRPHVNAIATSLVLRLQLRAKALGLRPVGLPGTFGEHQEHEPTSS